MTDGLNHNGRKQEKVPGFQLEIERLEFLKMGLVITGIFAGGSILSLVSNVRNAYSLDAYRNEYQYKPHYAMTLRQDRCIDCKRCMEACVAANSVPDYGWRTMILKR